MLTSEEVEIIAIDMLTNSAPRITGADADAFRVLLQADIDLAKKNNWVLELPFEIPDVGGQT